VLGGVVLFSVILDTMKTYVKDTGASVIELSHEDGVVLVRCQTTNADLVKGVDLHYYSGFLKRFLFDAGVRFDMLIMPGSGSVSIVLFFKVAVDAVFECDVDMHEVNSFGKPLLKCVNDAINELGLWTKT